MRLNFYYFNAKGIKNVVFNIGFQFLLFDFLRFKFYGKAQRNER